MGGLLLNALPLEVRGDAATVIGRTWRRDNEADRTLRERDDRGVAFEFYSLNSNTYSWPVGEGTLPEDVAERGDELTLGELPGLALASIARAAAVARLEHQGFEKRRGGLARPAELSRRRRNLLEQTSLNVPEGVGVYGAVALQGLHLFGDGHMPGEVALIVDQWMDYALEVPVSALAEQGIDIAGMRVRWNHASGCGCDRSARYGDAGRLAHENLADSVELSDPAGQVVDAPVACLTPHAHRPLMVEFLARRSGRGVHDTSEQLQAALQSSTDLRTRWRALDAMRDLLGQVELLPSVSGTFGAPLEVPPKDNLAGQVRPVVLPQVTEGKLNFQYGAPQLESNAAVGLGKHGPYDEAQPRQAELSCIVVSPRAFEQEAKKLQGLLLRGLQRFKGLRERYHLSDVHADLTLFDGVGTDDYKQAVLAASKQTPDIVFLVTEDGFRYARYGQNPYLAAKSALATAGTPSQAITVESLRQPDNSLQWIADSLGLASYTKVGNIAYVLHDREGGRELVLGVGRHDVANPSGGGRRQKFGASAAFRQDGDFLFAGSTTPVSNDRDYETNLKALIESSITRYTEQQGGPPERIVIYLFKRTGAHELYAVKNAIGDRDIEFALLHVNRHSPLWLVEQKGQSLGPPQRGTTVALSTYDRLLITGDHRKPGAANPVRLVLDRKSTYTKMDRLVEQAYGFTKTSYRGFLQGNEPSPILFGRLLARKVEELMPYGFDPAAAAGPLGDKPWFL